MHNDRTYISDEETPQRRVFEIAGLIEETISNVTQALKKGGINVKTADPLTLLDYVYRYSIHNDVNPRQVYFIMIGAKMPKHDRNGQIRFDF